MNNLSKGKQSCACGKKRQTRQEKEKKRTFFLKDKENIIYSNYFNNAKLGWCIFPVITDI